MKIEIKQPLELCLEVVETDEHVPSMRVQARIVVAQFQHMFRYDGFFWIECANWDKFTQSLRSPSAEGMALRDMSDCFIFSIQEIGGCLSIALELAKADLDDSRQTTCTFISRLDEDVFAKIQNEFFEFPVWW